MKKFFALAAIAFAAIAMVSCEKNPSGNNENNGDNGNETPKKVLLALASEVTEEGEFLYGRQFSYNENGTLAGVYEIGSWGSYNLTAEWNDNTITFKEDANEENPEGKVAFTWTLGNNGYVASCTTGKSVYTYEYDAEGHLVKVFESYENSEPELKSVMTWTNGNLTSWTRENRIENEDGTKSPEIKVQTYTEEVNTAGIHTAYNDKNANLSKWMLELGFFGKASKNLLNTDKWSNAEKDAKFEYRYDDDNYVVAEIKYYMNDDLTTYKLDDENYFLWEAAE